MIFGRKRNPELEKFSDLLEMAVIGLYNERGNIVFTKTQKEKKPIIEYEGKIRANGMEKFDNEPTYVSAVNFFVNKQDMEKKKALGALIVYVKEEYLPILMKRLQYPPIDDENPEAMLDSCGTLCNIVAGRFKSEITSAGYVELEWSHFVNYRNSAIIGISFCPSEYDMYELRFDIDGKKNFVVDMTMGIVPKR